MSKHPSLLLVMAGSVQTVSLEVDIRWCPMCHHCGQRQGEELVRLRFSAGKVHRHALTGTPFAYGCYFGQLSGRLPGPSFDLEALVYVFPDAGSATRQNHLPMAGG